MGTMFYNNINFIFILINILIAAISVAGQFNCEAQWAPQDPATGCCGQDLSGGFRSEDLQNLLPSNRRSSNDSTPFEGGIIPSRRISEGTQTQLGQFPWMMFLELSFDQTTTSVFCSGSLISPLYILTAAHCVYGEGRTLVNMKIKAAEYDLRTFPTDCVHVAGNQQCVENILIYPENVVIHPQYYNELLHNDIALIKLRNNAPYTNFIRPICLPSFDIDRPDFANLPLQIAGWGQINPYSYGEGIKLTTVVGLVPYDVCRNYIGYLINSHICAIGAAGRDHCPGDSGGPLMLVYGGTYYLVGIISGKDGDTYCGSPVPSLYTNVFKFLPWIKMQLGI